jgi:hypothetical protein
MKKFVEKNIKKANKYLSKFNSEIIVDLKKDCYFNSRKIIIENVSKSNRGIYIISMNRNLRNVIYVGQSVTCIRERILKHISAVYCKTSANMTYRRFFSSYKNKRVFITIILINKELQISNEEVELLLRIKEVMLTNELKPAFVFLRTKSEILK